MFNYPEDHHSTAFWALVIGLGVPLSLPWLLDRIGLTFLVADRLLFGIMWCLFTFVWVGFTWRVSEEISESIEGTKVEMAIGLLTALLFVGAAVAGIVMEFQEIHSFLRWWLS